MRLVPLLLLAACAAPSRPWLTLERTFEKPEGTLPFRFSFNRDGSKLGFLRARGADALTELWVHDVATGRDRVLVRVQAPQKLTDAQKAARERRRESARGIGRYWWNPVDDSVLLALSGDLYRTTDGPLEQLTKTEAAERDPRWSPDGNAIAFVRDRNVFVLRDGVETQLTTAGGGTKSCGLAEFIAMEELGRHEGFWWSKDGASIAYVEFDEAAVPFFNMHDYLDPVGKTKPQRYPRAGDKNVVWSLKVVPAAGGAPVEMKVAGEYLVRVDWMPDGRVAVQTSDRAQRALTLSACDPKTGAGEVLVVERDEAWVRFHSDLRFLENGRFLWPSERDGRRRLYVYGDGAPRAITGAGHDVVSVHRVLGDRVAYTSAEGETRYLRVASLDGSADERKQAGAATMGPGGAYVLTSSRAGVPPTIRLGARDLGGAAALPGLPRPEFVTIPADDGTPLRAMVYRRRGTGAGPAIVYCYGGPGSHLVNDRWGGRGYLWHARMVAKGYTILTVDNRGAGGYGRDFCRIVSGRLLDYETRDQTAAARWLGKQPYVDAARIGIWGWSYGGSLTLMCLLQSPDVFAAGVAVAPVTDWRDYDTAYTERYLGLPKDNPEGYRLSSPISFAERLRRPCLLAHGLMDDNVHFRGAIAFVDKVQRAGGSIDVDFYPRGAHGIGGKTERTVLFRRMEEFWKRWLGR